MSQLDPELSFSCSRACPYGSLQTKKHVISTTGPSYSPTNPSDCFRMIYALGKRRAAVSSNDLEADFKEETSNRRKL